MKNTLSRSHRALCTALAAVAALLVFTAPAYAQAAEPNTYAPTASQSGLVSGNHHELRSDSPFSGTWVHNVQIAPGLNAPALVTIHSEGTMNISSAFMFGMPGFPFRFSPIHSVWKRTGPRSMVATSIFFVFDADGVLLRYQRNRCPLKFSHDFDSYSGVEFMETLDCPGGIFSCPDPLDPAAKWIPDPSAPLTGSPATGKRVKVVLPGPLNP